MTTTPDGSLKILVVDDEPAMVGALGALLGQAGHRIVAAGCASPLGRTRGVPAVRRATARTRASSSSARKGVRR